MAGRGFHDLGKKAFARGTAAPKAVTKRLKAANPTVTDVRWNPKVKKYQAFRKDKGRPICVKQGTDTAKMAAEMSVRHQPGPDFEPDADKHADDMLEWFGQMPKTATPGSEFTGSNERFRNGYDRIRWRHG